MTSFTPDILHSYQQFVEFFNGEKIDEKVRKELLEPQNAPASTCGSGCCSIVVALFKKAIGSMLYYMGCVKRGLQLDIEAEQVMHAKGSTKGDNGLLAPAVNTYSFDAIDVYALSTLKVDAIPSIEVRDAIKAGKEIRFEKNNGFCRGSSLWFIRSYLKTKSLFANHRQHLEALAIMFSRGASPQAALIQKLHLQPDFMQLKHTVQTEAFTNEELHKAQVPMPEAPSDSSLQWKTIDRIFKEIDPGAYYLRVPGHGMAYICPEPGKGYLHDPNEGTAVIESDNDFRALVDIIYYYDDLMKKRSPDSKEGLFSLIRTELVN